jgi:uncharacterized protein (TIGR02300 family)
LGIQGAKAFDSAGQLWQADPTSHNLPSKGNNMPNPDWGTKRLCPTTGKRFYDMNRMPIISPYTGEVVDIESARRKLAASVIARVAPEKDEEALVVDLDADEDLLAVEASGDSEIDDELLEDDGEENVSLDELADVPGGDDEL